MAEQDPYASIAKPIASAVAPTADPSDPYASIAKPIPDAPGTTGVLGAINKVGEVSGDVATGFVKGAGDTVSGVSHLLHKIPVVGETLAPSEGISALDKLDESKNTAQSVGKGIEGIAEFATGDEALEGVAKASKFVALAQKYPLVARTLELATAHPWLAKIITEGTKGAVSGGVEGAVKGAQKDDAVGGAETGALLGGATGVVKGAVPGAIQAVKNTRINPFRAVAEAGAEASQAPAQSAVRTSVQAIADGAGNATPSVASGIASKPLLAGAETVMDEPLKLLEANKRAAYAAQDQVVGFNLADLRQTLKNDVRALSQLGGTPAAKAERKVLTESIADSTRRIQIAEAKLTAAKIDPNAAAAKNKQWEAAKLIKDNLWQSMNPDGDVNIKKLINLTKNDRFNKQFGDRLAQAMGGNTAAADQFMNDLVAAQKAGVRAMHIQHLVNWAGGLIAGGIGAGAGVSGVKAVMPLLAPPAP